MKLHVTIECAAVYRWVSIKNCNGVNGVNGVNAILWHSMPCCSGQAIDACDSIRNRTDALGWHPASQVECWRWTLR